MKYIALMSAHNENEAAITCDYKHSFILIKILQFLNKTDKNKYKIHNKGYEKF